MRLLTRISNRWFKYVHLNNLVYNTCWEDPRLDRVALKLGPDDSVLVITSAGCNALDYALEAPRRVDAVDMNPRQNALLDLKIAGIKALDYETFFSLFGRGQHADCKQIYLETLRPQLNPTSRAYWDVHFKFFKGKGWRKSFYYRGTSGTFARVIKFYIDRVAKVREAVDEILEAKTVAQQREIFDNKLRRAFWKKSIKWMVARDTTLSFLGVPQAQRRQVELDYKGGIAGFIEDSIEAVFAKLPIHDNYFWRVYLTGQYEPNCCPEYLKKENFEKLKGGPSGGGLVDRVRTHTASVQQFLENHDESISRFILLDHQDWLSTAGNQLLEGEWQGIVQKAAPGARVLWRSGGLRTDFVDVVKVWHGGRRRPVGELLTYHRDLAAELHEKDRVHTYGSFHIADLNTNGR